MGRSDWNNPSSLYEVKPSVRTDFSSRESALVDEAMFWNIASLIPAVRVGRGVLTAGRLLAGSRPVKAVIWAKRPVHQTMVDLPFLWHPTRITAAPKIVTESLKWRKRAGLVALGVSTINPLQNIRYAQQKDWTRLGINLRYPIVGIPIYEFISNRLGAPDSAASPIAPPKPQLPKRPRRPYRQRIPARPPTSGGGPESRPELVTKGVSQGTDRRPRRSKAPGRSKCPPGYYWSWKKKTCVKSKYR